MEIRSAQGGLVGECLLRSRSVGKFGDACGAKDPFGLVVVKSTAQDRRANLCWKASDTHGALVIGSRGTHFAGFVARAPSGDFPISVSSCSEITKTCFVMADSYFNIVSFARPLVFRGLALDVKWAANGDPGFLEVTFKGGTKKSVPFRTLP